MTVWASSFAGHFPRYWRLHVELDPDIEEHSSSDPNNALGAPSPEMTKSSEKGERDEKGRSRPLLYGKGARKDHSTAKYI
jgi:hypothetical protein